MGSDIQLPEEQKIENSLWESLWELTEVCLRTRNTTRETKLQRAQINKSLKSSGRTTSGIRKTLQIVLIVYNQGS